MGLQRQYEQGLRWSVAGSAAVALLQVVQVVLFARFAGPEAAGDFYLAAALIAIGLPFAEIGIGQAVVYLEQLTARQMTGLVVFSLFWSTLLYIGLFVLSPAALHFFDRSDVPALLRLMGLVWLLAPLQALLTGRLQRLFRFDVLAYQESVLWLASVLLVSVLAWRGWGSWAMAWGWVFRHLGAVLAMLWLLRRKRFPIRHFSLDWRVIQPFVQFGITETASRVADQAFNNLDKLLVGRLLGPVALGLYNLGCTALVMPTGRLGYMVSRVSFPVFARMHHEQQALSGFFRQSMLDAVYLLYPVYALILVFAPEVVSVLFGDAWLPAVPVIRIMSLIGYVRAISVPGPALLRGIGRPEWSLYWLALLTLASNGFMGLFLAFFPTITAAAWSQVVAQGLVGMWLFRQVLAKANIQSEGLWPETLRIGVPVALLLVSVVCLERWAEPVAFWVKLFLVLIFGWWCVFFSPAWDRLRQFLGLQK